MTDILKVAFIFIAPEADPTIHNSCVKTKHIHLKTLAVSHYQQGCDLIDALYQEGITGIELCSGFCHQGVARMVEAASGRMQVGVVRFDNHPLLGFRSGDSINAAHAD